MKRDRRIVVWILAGALTSIGVKAVTPGAAEQPYLAIVDRNVFNLHPPAAVDPSELNKSKVQIPKLTLNGITTILGKKMVILTSPATKPGGPPQTLMLAEGQAEDEVEAKQIDEKAGVVKVNNHGESQTLDFDHDGTKPAAPAGNPASPSMTLPPMPAAPPANTLPQPGNFVRPLRTLQSRADQNASSLNVATMNQQQTSTPEQQALMIEAQRVKAMDEGNSDIANMLPPTEMTGEVKGSYETQ